MFVGVSGCGECSVCSLVFQDVDSACCVPLCFRMWRVLVVVPLCFRMWRVWVAFVHVSGCEECELCSLVFQDVESACCVT